MRYYTIVDGELIYFGNSNFEWSKSYVPYLTPDHRVLVGSEILFAFEPAESEYEYWYMSWNGKSWSKDKPITEEVVAKYPELAQLKTAQDTHTYPSQELDTTL